jgi:hypothetical protein
MPFMESEDEMGMMQYICSDQLDTSTCDDVELANINDNVPHICADLAEMGGGDGDGPPACVLDQLMPFMEAEDEAGMMQYVCSDQLDTSTCDDVELANINDNVPGMCAELGMGGCNPDTAVCVESDLFLIQQGADFESLTPGCQCCFMSIQDDLSADPFVLCLEPLFPQVDFCADPGNAQSNPDAVPGHCLHLCENYNALWEEVEAAGCFNDQHEDYICVTEGVFAPGEMQPWGETCCSWCGDSDGDGNPDYQGCCEGMRADGEMGCEDTRCEWLCNGINCFEHGEDQATCEGIGGTWETLGTSCEEQIAGQGMYQVMYELSGMGVDLAAIFWLADYGDVCCTGYEPAGPGSCDDDIDNYVSVSIVCFAL